MEDKQPKRRKDKDNPYTINYLNGKYYICFRDIQKKKVSVEISKELFNTFNLFELEDKRQLNIYDRHMEHSIIYEWTFDKQFQKIEESAEDEAMRNFMFKELHSAINRLSETKRRRLIYYYFDGLTYKQIAKIENCSYQAVMKSVASAKEKLKKYLE